MYSNIIMNIELFIGKYPGIYLLVRCTNSNNKI